jgi:hypothetical protein
MCAKAVMSVPRAQAHLEALGGLTCTLMTLSSSSSEPSLREALDSLLEVWSSMAVDLQMREEEPAMLQALAPYTAKIFRAYIEKSLRDAVREVEEWDAAEEEHEDKSVGEERLVSVGCTARAMLGDALALLSQLIHERTEALRGVLMSGRRLSTKEAGVALEQLLSLISISARCIADEAEGETPMIPDAVAKVSAEAGARGVDDPVVVLTNQVVETIKVFFPRPSFFLLASFRLASSCNAPLHHPLPCVCLSLCLVHLCRARSPVSPVLSSALLPSCACMNLCVCGGGGESGSGWVSRGRAHGKISQKYSIW